MGSGLKRFQGTDQVASGLPNPGQETDRIVGFRQLKNALIPTKTNERINMMATRLSMFLTVLASAVLNDVPSVN